MNRPELITIYDKGGKPLVCHPIDAKEALATGKYFKENPKAPKEAPESSEKPEDTPEEPKGDSGIEVHLKAMGWNQLKTMARDAGIEVHASLKKDILVQKLIEAGVE